MTSHTPSSSRMLTRYLTDIEQMLDGENADAALREAFDLPRIAVALTHPQLHCSHEQIQTWCQEWIGPAGPATRAPALDYERVGRSLSERVIEEEPGIGDAVPTRALRRLRLRRHVRTPPRGFSGGRRESLGPRDTETLDLCTALVQAARSWYARSACHNTIVQANLARLAVLR